MGARLGPPPGLRRGQDWAAQPEPRNTSRSSALPTCAKTEVTSRIPEQLITPAIVDGASLATFEKLLIRSLVAHSSKCATYIRSCHIHVRMPQ